jgi:hypothetical protein
MMKPVKLNKKRIYFFPVLILVVVLLSGCISTRPGYIIPQTEEPTPTPEITLTPYPSRPVYDPGTLVEYTAQIAPSMRSGKPIHSFQKM